MGISKKDSDWLVDKLGKWKIGDVFRLLGMFGAHLTLVDKKNLGVKQKKKSKT